VRCLQQISRQLQQLPLTVRCKVGPVHSCLHQAAGQADTCSLCQHSTCVLLTGCCSGLLLLLLLLLLPKRPIALFIALLLLCGASFLLHRPLLLLLLLLLWGCS
jgi:hypothetical protein